MTDELKPVRCGCGGEAMLLVDMNNYSIMCRKCGINTENYDTEAEAIMAWNKAMGAKDINVPDKKERIAKVTNIHEKIGSSTVFTLIGKCKCGELVSSWDKYCHECGSRLEWE